MIDIDKYAILAMDKLEMSGYYSEMDPAELLESIRSYLSEVYNDRVSILSLKLDLEQINGGPISNDKYKQEYNDIRREIVDIVNQLSMTSKEKLPELPMD